MSDERYSIKRSVWFPFPVVNVWDTHDWTGKPGKWGPVFRNGKVVPSDIPYRRRRGTFFRMKTAKAFVEYIKQQDDRG